MWHPFKGATGNLLAVLRPSAIQALDTRTPGQEGKLEGEINIPKGEINIPIIYFNALLDVMFIKSIASAARATLRL